MSESTYYRYLKKWSAVEIRCPSCMKRFTLKQYVEDHVPKCHAMILKRTCIFCWGGKRWANGKRNYKHIVPCMKTFMEENEMRCPVEEEKHTEREEMVPICTDCKHFKSEPRQLFDRKMDRMNEYVSFYDSVFERPEEFISSDITFSEQSGLGADVYAIVQRFLQDDLEWCHIMVKHDNFHNFVEAMEWVKDEIFLLPFWCLCDGLGGMQRITHRHMILAYKRKIEFGKIWTTQVRYDFLDGGKSKSCYCIKTVWHLIRAIQYVSQRKASCDGTQIEDEVVGNNLKLSHFYINRPLHDHAIVVMSTFFKGGMENLLVEQNKRKNVVGWLPHVKEIRDAYYNKKYGAPIGVTGFKFIKCVLPLAKHLEPTEEETDLHLWWIGENKLYLRINPSLENLSPEEWYAHQVSRGNTVWGIRNELYVLGPSQQNVLRQIKVAQKKTKEMEKSRWEKKYSELEAKYEQCKMEKEELLKDREEQRQKLQTLQVKLMCDQTKIMSDQNEMCLKFLREVIQILQR